MVPKPGVECPVGVATTICTFTDVPVPKWLAAAAASAWTCASLGLAGTAAACDQTPASRPGCAPAPYWPTVASHAVPPTEPRNRVRYGCSPLGSDVQPQRSTKTWGRVWTGPPK